MSDSLPVSNQKYALKKAILFYSIAFVILAGIALQPFIPNQVLTKDALKVAGGEFYYGLLSNLGILLWCGTAFICFFCFRIMKESSLKKDSQFILWSGLLSLLLLLDDMFQIHDQVGPDYLGINENLALAFYPISIISFLIYFKKNILKTSFLVLLSSMVLLGVSVGLDTLLPDGYFIVEDGFKFLGIVG